MVMDNDTRGRFLNATSWFDLDANTLYKGVYPGDPGENIFFFEWEKFFVYSHHAFDAEEILSRFFSGDVMIVDRAQPLRLGIPEHVMDAIHVNWAQQDLTRGAEPQQSLPGFLLLVEKEIMQAKRGWTHDLKAVNSPLAGLTRAVAVGLRCLIQYGVTGNARPTNDLSNNNADDGMTDFLADQRVTTF